MSRTKTIVKNWQGNDVLETENPNDQVLVWAIEPNPYDSSFDYVVVRSYSDAVECAKKAVEHIMGVTKEVKLRNGGVALKIWLEPIKIEDLEALED